MPNDEKRRRSTNGAGNVRTKKVIMDGKEYEYFEGKVTIGYDPVTGKQIQKSVTGKNKRDVRKKMTAMIAAVDNNTYSEPSKTYLCDWLKEWHKSFVNGKVKPYTSDAYEGYINNHIIPAIGKTRLCDLDALTIQRFYNNLKLSPKTLKNVHLVLHRALGKAKALKMISNNPAEDCELPKQQKSEIKPMEQEDIQRLYAELDNEKFRNVILVTLFTGLRQGEVLGLTWDCIDFEAGTILVNKQLILSSKKAGAHYLLSSTKTSQTRLIYAAPTVFELLKEQKKWQEHYIELSEGCWNNEWNLVFTNELGKHLCHSWVYRCFKSIAERAGLGYVRFHDLRHSCAVANLEAGTDIKTVQKILGHSSAAFTMSVYAHATERMQRQSAANMENFIKSVTSHKSA